MLEGGGWHGLGGGASQLGLEQGTGGKEGRNVLSPTKEDALFKIHFILLGGGGIESLTGSRFPVDKIHAHSVRFSGRARQSRDGLMESFSCHRSGPPLWADLLPLG